jgi:hypothetical protein
MLHNVVSKLGDRADKGPGRYIRNSCTNCGAFGSQPKSNELFVGAFARGFI